MKDILTAPFLKELCDTTDNMYRLGWNERNGGNISILLKDEEISPFLEGRSVLRRLPLAVAFPELAGRFFLVTGTGKYFKNVSKDPENALGLIRLSDDGAEAELYWGWNDGGRFTSEIIMHLGAHRERLKSDPNQRVVMHAHPANIVSMTHIHKGDEREFTRKIWRSCTECIVIFPDGIALLPWMVSSGSEIGLASAKKFKDFRILVWGLHGCTVTGSSLDEAFGLLETVEKGAEIYMKVAATGKKLEETGISDGELLDVAKAFGLHVRDNWLNQVV